MYEYSGLCNRLGCIFKSEIRSNLLSSGHFALPDGDRLPSGMAASAVEALDHPDDKSYGWSSRKGAKGIAKKVAYLFVIAVGMVIDYVIIQTSGVLGFNLPNTMLSLLVTVWYMLNEALSITENAGRMGAPVPEWLMKYIAALKNKIDSSRENVSSET